MADNRLILECHKMEQTIGRTYRVVSDAMADLGIAYQANDKGRTVVVTERIGVVMADLRRLLDSIN